MASEGSRVSLAKKVDYVEQALDRLLEQYKNKPKLQGLIEPWLSWVQKVESAAWEVLTLRYMNGEGVQLDILGRILGAPRADMSDDNYRVRLKAQGIILRSNGVPPQLETLLVLCCPHAFTITEHYTATLIVELIPPIQYPEFDIRNLNDILVQAKAGGVRLELIFSETTLGQDLRFADFNPDDPTYSVTVFDDDHGLGDTANTVGGRFVAMISQ